MGLRRREGRGYVGLKRREGSGYGAEMERG